MTDLFLSLPQFTVARVDSNPPQCIGVFDSPIVLGDQWIVYLADANWHCIEGRSFKYDRATRQSIFVPTQSGDLKRIAVGKTYAYLEGYWGARVELVMDLSRDWKRKAFTPRGDWDHEHCAICWEKIAEFAQPFGYADQHDEWVCEKCFEDHVHPRLPTFLDQHAISQIRGEQ